MHGLESLYQRIEELWLCRFFRCEFPRSEQIFITEEAFCRVIRWVAARHPGRLLSRQPVKKFAELTCFNDFVQAFMAACDMVSNRSQFIRRRPIHAPANPQFCRRDVEIESGAFVSRETSDSKRSCNVG